MNSRRNRACATLLGLLVLSACASPIRNQVTAYHDWPQGLSERTFRMAPPEGVQDSLATRTFQNIVRERLVAAGFRQSPRPALEVTFRYKESRQDGQVVEQVPIVRSQVAIGSWGRRGGVSVGFPIWWGWPYYDTVRSVTYYVRELELTIADIRGGEPKRIYEATARNRGGEPAAAQALPYLMDAVLDDFPGRSGVARQVSLERTEAQ